MKNKKVMSPLRKNSEKSENTASKPENIQTENSAAEYHLRSNKKYSKVAMRPTFKKPNKTIQNSETTLKIQENISNKSNAIRKEDIKLEENISEVTVLNKNDPTTNFNESFETIKLEELEILDEKHEITNTNNLNTEKLEISENCKTNITEDRSITTTNEYNNLIDVRSSEKNVLTLEESNNVIIKYQDNKKINDSVLQSQIKKYFVDFEDFFQTKQNKDNIINITINKIENTEKKQGNFDNQTKDSRKLSKSEREIFNDNNRSRSLRVPKRQAKVIDDVGFESGYKINSPKKYKKSNIPDNNKRKRTYKVATRSELCANDVQNKLIDENANKTVIKSPMSIDLPAAQNVVNIINSSNSSVFAKLIRDTEAAEYIKQYKIESGKLKMIDGGFYIAYPKQSLKIDESKLSLKLIVFVSKRETSKTIQFAESLRNIYTNNKNNSINQYCITIYPPNPIEKFIKLFEISLQSTRNFTLTSLNKFIVFYTSENALILSNYEKIIIGRHLLSEKCLSLMLEKYNQHNENKLFEENEEFNMRNNRNTFQVIVNAPEKKNSSSSLTDSYFINGCGYKQKIETIDIMKRNFEKSKKINPKNKGKNILNNKSFIPLNDKNPNSKFSSSCTKVSSDLHTPKINNIFNTPSNVNATVLKDYVNNEENKVNWEKSKLVNIQNLPKISSSFTNKKFFTDINNTVYKDKNETTEFQTEIANKIGQSLQYFPQTTKYLSHTFISSKQEQINDSNWERNNIVNDNINKNNPGKSFHLGDFNLQQEIEEFDRILGNVFKLNDMPNKLPNNNIQNYEELLKDKYIENKSTSIEPKILPIRPKAIKGVYNNTLNNNYNFPTQYYGINQPMYNHNHYNSTNESQHFEKNPENFEDVLHIGRMNFQEDKSKSCEYNFTNPDIQFYDYNLELPYFDKVSSNKDFYPKVQEMPEELVDMVLNMEKEYGDKI